MRTLGKQRYLAYSLLLLLLVMPMSHDQVGSRLSVYSMLVLVFVTGPFAVARSRFAIWATCILAVLVLVPGIASVIGDFQAAFKLSVVVGFVLFASLATLVGRHLLSEDVAVSSETLWAAINVYVLIGLSFAFLYTALYLLGPEMFVGNFMGQALDDQLQGFVYFSFVTLTTLGYGDIAPNGAFVATLAFLEALIGQLYVAIMIARIVGLYIVRGA